MKKPLLALLLTSTLAMTAFAEDGPADIPATTLNGDVVMLHPNGRWEFVDSQKAAKAEEIAKEFPENQGCPAGMQGGLLGMGRCIKQGDKDYNRGSLSGKGR